MTLTYLLLGSNSGDRSHYLDQARKAVEEQVGATDASSVYETAAWGKTNQPAFLNQVLAVRTDLEPRELLERILSIEHDLGRTRTEKWAQRTIDIDILFYGDTALDETGLSIPHPMIQARRFTLVPLAEIAPGFIHPVLQKSVTQLLEECPDPLEVRKVR